MSSFLIVYMFKLLSNEHLESFKQGKNLLSYHLDFRTCRIQWRHFRNKILMKFDLERPNEGHNDFSKSEC